MRARNWSVNLETEEYAADRTRIVSDACEAIADTVDIRYFDQCGCGGYVFRITKIARPS
ncbi:MAG: hypothetical protein ACYCYO_19995 [Bacilli bacterium]